MQKQEVDTYDSWIKLLREAQKQLPSGEGLTTPELTNLWKTTLTGTRRILRTLLAQSRIEVCHKRVLTIAGILTTVPSYKLKTK